MKVNKLKILSTVICCLLTALWSGAQCAEQKEVENYYKVLGKAIHSDGSIVPVNLPVIDTQMIEVKKQHKDHKQHKDETIGYLTIYTSASTFKLNEDDNVDYYHLMQHGVFCPITDKCLVSSFTLGAKTNNDKVFCDQTSPQTVINKTQYTSEKGFDFNPSLNIGSSGVTPNASLGANFTFSTKNSRVVELLDMSVINLCGELGRNVEWIYKINDPKSDIAQGTIPFCHQWVWTSHNPGVGIIFSNHYAIDYKTSIERGFPHITNLNVFPELGGAGKKIELLKKQDNLKLSKNVMDYLNPKPGQTTVGADDSEAPVFAEKNQKGRGDNPTYDDSTKTFTVKLEVDNK